MHNPAHHPPTDTQTRNHYPPCTAHLRHVRSTALQRHLGLQRISNPLAPCALPAHLIHQAPHVDMVHHATKAHLVPCAPPALLAPAVPPALFAPAAPPALLAPAAPLALLATGAPPALFAPTTPPVGRAARVQTRPASPREPQLQTRPGYRHRRGARLDLEGCRPRFAKVVWLRSAVATIHNGRAPGVSWPLTVHAGSSGGPRPRTPRRAAPLRARWSSCPQVRSRAGQGAAACAPPQASTAGPAGFHRNGGGSCG